jgi:uncharacterized membrane protein
LYIISASFLGIFIINLIIFLLRPGGYYIIDSSLQLSLVLFLLSLIPLVTKSTLFGGWKKGLYGQKQRWDAFAHNIAEGLKQGYVSYSDSD